MCSSDLHQVRGDAIEFHHHHADDLGALRNLIGDTQQLLDSQAVGGLIKERCELVHSRYESDALSPRAELNVLFDARVQVTDATARFGYCLALNFEYEPKHTVRRGMLWTHVDDNALTLALRSTGDGVPVLTRDREDTALRGAI